MGFTRDVHVLKTLSIKPDYRMQMHQAQVPFPKMPTATMSREDLTPQKSSALPLDQVRATKESRAQPFFFFALPVEGVKYLLAVGSIGGSREVSLPIGRGAGDVCVVVVDCAD